MEFARAVFYYYIIVFILYIILLGLKLSNNNYEYEAHAISILLLGHILGIIFSLLVEATQLIPDFPPAYPSEPKWLFVIVDILCLIAGIASLNDACQWIEVRDFSYLYIFVGLMSSVLCFYKNRSFISF